MVGNTIILRSVAAIILYKRYNFTYIIPSYKTVMEMALCTLESCSLHKLPSPNAGEPYPVPYHMAHKFMA